MKREELIEELNKARKPVFVGIDPVRDDDDDLPNPTKPVRTRFSRKK